ESLLLAQAALQLGSDEVPVRQAAAQKLGDARQPIVRALLQQRLDVEEDAAVKASLKASLSAADRSLATSAALGQASTAGSLGSVRLREARGLGIASALVGVIIMGPGELIMRGAYATYVGQSLFRRCLPGAFAWCLLAALPAAFLSSAV